MLVLALGLAGTIGNLLDRSGAATCRSGLSCATKRRGLGRERRLGWWCHPRTPRRGRPWTRRSRLQHLPLGRRRPPVHARGVSCRRQGEDQAALGERALVELDRRHGWRSVDRRTIRSARFTRSTNAALTRNWDSTVATRRADTPISRPSSAWVSPARARSARRSRPVQKCCMPPVGAVAACSARTSNGRV